MLYSIRVTTFCRQAGQVHAAGVSAKDVVRTTVVVAGAITTVGGAPPNPYGGGGGLAPPGCG